MRRAMRFFLGCLITVAIRSGWGLESHPAPPPGPSGQPGKTVVFIASDYKNGGVMGAYRGFEEAARKLGWQVRLQDGQGKRIVQATLLSQAVVGRPDGIVFGGFDPQDFIDHIAAARRRGIALVGWHAGKEPGPTSELFVNVTTRPADVAQLAVDYVLRDAIANRKPVGVVIFNDNQFAVANAKTEAMKKGIEACPGYRGCKVLAVENVPISDAAVAMPAVVPRLASVFGNAWTYSLAINDAYFDEINYPLIAVKRLDMVNVSAGDGSSKALSRIGAGVSRQAATVAEPIRLQGYQLADELNRAFAGAPPSGFQARPILVTPELLKSTGNKGIEADLGFEAAYERIWSKK